MTKFISAIAAVLLCFLLALALSSCGKSSSITAAATTTTSNITMAVAAGNQQVTVSWNDPNSTSSSTYNVYCSGSTAPDSTRKNNGGTLIASNTTSPFVHTGLTNGTTYYYFVTKVTGSTEGPASLAAMAVPMAATPAAPTGMTISTKIESTNNTGTVTLTIPNADSNLTYNVYWTSDATKSSDLKANGTKITNAFTHSTAATFNHYNLPFDGKTYYYAVTAQGDSESTVSQTLTAAPVLTKFTNYSATGSSTYTPSQYGSPQSIEADVANQAVTIKWGAPASNNTPTKFEDDNSAKTLTNAARHSMTYNLYYWESTGSKGSTPQISNIVPNSDSTALNTLTLNSNLANNTSYSFCVAAVQTVFDSTGKTISTKETLSATISVMPQAKVLAVPSAVSASAGDQQVSLSWTKVSDPAGGSVKYNVYYTTTLPASVTKQSDWKLIGTTTATSFEHSGLALKQTYYYVITSVSDQSGESAGNWTSSQVSMTL